MSCSDWLLYLGVSIYRYYTGFFAAFHAMLAAVDTFCKAHAVTCHLLIGY